MRLKPGKSHEDLFVEEARFQMCTLRGWMPLSLCSTVIRQGSSKVKRKQNRPVPGSWSPTCEASVGPASTASDVCTKGWSDGGAAVRGLSHPVKRSCQRLSSSDLLHPGRSGEATARLGTPRLCRSALSSKIDRTRQL